MKPGGKPPNKFPLVRRSSVTPDDPALSAMGLSAWSRASGMTTDSLLAVLASILPGLAGPDAWLQDSMGPTRLAKLNLLTATEDHRLQQLIERLTTPLDAIQVRLVANMSRNIPVALEMVACGPYSNPTTFKLSEPETREKSLRFHADTLMRSPQPGASNALLADLAEDPIPPRIEAVRHSRFLILGADGRSLNSQVENCHQRTALIIRPKLELARKGPEPAKVLKILINLFDGETVTKRPDSLERGRDSSILAKALAILALTQPEIDALHAMEPDHLDRFLWLMKGDSHDGPKPGDVNDCEIFFAAYEQAVMEILNLRREGKRLMMGVETRKMKSKFDSELRAYQSEIQQTAAGAGPWARGLPQTLFWALGFLRRAMPADRRPDDESLMMSLFAAARRLVKNHLDQVLLITKAKLVKDRRKLARRIVKKLPDGTCPQTFREISRYSRDQKREVVAPVVDALLEVEVLVRDEDGIHTLGPVDLADVEEILNQKFARY
jgi:hypothetical protein